MKKAVLWILVVGCVLGLWGQVTFRRSGVVVVAKVDLTAQAANIGTALFYTIPAAGAGQYRVSGYTVVTQAATTSSVLPSVFIASYTDNDTNIVTGTAAFGYNSPLNTLAANSAGGSGSPTSTVFNAKAGTTINYGTLNYASVGGTPMQYALHIKLEYLGQ
jgi:hypothetical protein